MTQRNPRNVGSLHFLIEPNRNFINANYKEIRGKRTTLANATSRIEGSTRLAIDQNGERRSGDASPNESNKIGVQTKIGQSHSNETPF